MNGRDGSRQCINNCTINKRSMLEDSRKRTAAIGNGGHMEDLEL
jgi:hypothetical protein